MHEMSLVESVLQIIEESAQTQKFSQVKTVILEIGELAAVEPDAMQFCFDAVMSGTVADGAQLEVIDVQGAAWCEHCNTSVRINDQLDACPQCGHVKLNITAGTEMRVKELIVE